MGSLFSGSTESEVKIPEWLEEAAKANLGQAQDVASIGYTPYYGPDVAAFNPTQQAAFQNTADASRAFGLSAPTDAMAGMPQAQDFGGGVMGYSSQPLFQDAVDRFAADRPAQASLIDSFFIDPQTGQGGSVSSGNTAGMGGTRNTGTVAMQQAQQQSVNSPVSDQVRQDSPYGGYNVVPPTSAPVGTSTMPVQTYDSYDQFAAQQGAGTSPIVQPVTTDSFMSGMQPNTTMPSPTGNYDQFMQDSFNANLNASTDYTSPLSVTNYTQEDPSFMDSAGYYAGQLGRAFLDNSSIDLGYDLYNKVMGNEKGDVSDAIFGEATRPEGGISLTPQGQQQAAEMFPENPMLTQLNDIVGGLEPTQAPNMVSFDPTKEQAQQLEALGLTMNPAQGLSAPNSFYNAGNMLGTSAASQSPIKNLFDELDSKRVRDKEVKGIQRNFNRMR